MPSSSKDTSLIKLRNTCGRYLLFTGLGSYLLLSSFSWSAETSFLGAAGLGILLELLLENLFKSQRPPYSETSEQTVYSPSEMAHATPLNLQRPNRQYHD
ncbi:MAG: hypothetical protein AAGF01_29840 [Cyanobacteria bacterium P01_G01_bin.38]